MSDQEENKNTHLVGLCSLVDVGRAAVVVDRGGLSPGVGRHVDPSQVSGQQRFALAHMVWCKKGFAKKAANCF